MASRGAIGAQPPLAPNNNGAKKNRLVSAINYNNGISGNPNIQSQIKNGGAAAVR